MKTLEISVHGRAKNYKDVYYLVQGVWWKYDIPFWVKSYKKNEMKEYLEQKFDEFELKITWNYC